jgi:hypothetical protein
VGNVSWIIKAAGRGPYHCAAAVPAARRKWWTLQMVRALLWCALTACAVTASMDAQPAGADEIERQQAEPAVVVGQPLLAAIEAWLALQFNLPRVDHHPRIELVPPAKIAALRYQGLLSNPTTESAPNGHSSAASRSDVVAVYSDATQTIYLPEGWTGTTAAELSVLVHEMVHHVQNVRGLKYACPQEREKLAYMAQERWLGLFGRNLEADFELDAFSLLVKTRCLY